MKNQFDELAKGLAQSVTRRAALKKFGVGLAGMALAMLGMATKAQAGNGQAGDPCTSNGQCSSGLRCIYGHCSAPLGFGWPCQNSGDCQKGLVCRYSGPGGIAFGAGYYCMPK
jgi:hypothetical protein